VVGINLVLLGAKLGVGSRKKREEFGCRSRAAAERDDDGIASASKRVGVEKPFFSLFMKI
jgi:hypothetical protein